MTDIESLRLQIVKRLPARVRWPVDGTFVDFDFSRSEAPLKTVAPCNFNSATVFESEWASLQIFGEYDYAEGGGANPYLGVHSQTGAVFALDVENAPPMLIFNSDVDRFIQTLLALDQALRLRELPRARVEERLREIDPRVFERGGWRFFAATLEF